MKASSERRQFLKFASLLGGGLSALAPEARAGAIDAGGASAAADAAPSVAAANAEAETVLHWLDGVPASFRGATWGVPWPQGRVRRDTTFALREVGGENQANPVQSWPLAYWPDGTLKWTAHALAPGANGAAPAPRYALEVSDAAPAHQLEDKALASETFDSIVIDTGVLRCTLARAGKVLVRSIEHAGKPLLQDGRLVLLVDSGGNSAGDDEAAGSTRRVHDGAIGTVVIEQAGPLRAVVRIKGTHRHADGATLLPFVLRLYFYKHSDTVRLVHTLVYDLDPALSCLRGVGLRFGVPLAAPLHDRHIRFVGDNGGVFAEAVRGLTGLRRDAGGAAWDAQLSGRRVPMNGVPPAVGKGLRYIPAFGHYTLLQSLADGFSIAKRTAPGHGWVHAASGTRASGTAYVGSVDGGVAFGVRNFWQSYPGQIDIKGAETGLATVTQWLWAPQAPGMDLRFYHDGMGEDTYAKQRDALDITYEDYEPGFGSPYGVARTSEIEWQLLAATPRTEALVAISRRIQAPAQLLAAPRRLYSAGAFSEYWSPAQGAAQGLAPVVKLANQLAWSFDFYRNQVEQRKWYGFWDYGDVMHTYDAQRHVWRYDVGGFAWDNSELSTEIWLWHYFLHSGRADVFRMAEAMTRHTGEVDVHHLGPFRGLGTRHGVQHWGDSAKQLRISTALNRRFMYYLTADERIGDLLSEQVDAVEALRDVAPGRKLGGEGAQAHARAAAGERTHAGVAFGTDWGAVAAAWFTEWERSGQPRYRDKLLASMAGIAAQPLGFLAGGAVMDLRSGAFAVDAGASINVSHLSAVFGLPEICSELIRSVPQPAFRAAWLRYCRLYNATPAEQAAELGQDLGKLNLGQGHARLLGYVAVHTQNRAMLSKAWAQFFEGRAGLREGDLVSRKVRPPLVLAEVDEAPAVSTNAIAQWGLGAIGMLALDAAGTSIYQDDFKRFDRQAWAVEAEAGDPGAAAIAQNGALLMDAQRGLTVWLRTQLIGHYEISYTRSVLVEGRPQDWPHERLSDLNCFWEAQLADGGAPFARSGKLEDYDKLRLFYAGIGGNSNTTTRFRYYDGSGERKLLQEYTAPAYLLQANRPYRVRIVVDAQGTRLYLDEQLLFSQQGLTLGGGYFGFRSTQSRQKIEHFAVRRIA